MSQRASLINAFNATRTLAIVVHVHQGDGDPFVRTFVEMGVLVAASKPEHACLLVPLFQVHHFFFN